MRSAFCRGVELLSASEPGSIQSRGQVVESSPKSASGHLEDISGVTGVPQNVTDLKPVIDQLMRKVITIAVQPVSANSI
jgi:hypothetical protein